MKRISFAYWDDMYLVSVYFLLFDGLTKWLLYVTPRIVLAHWVMPLDSYHDIAYNRNRDGGKEEERGGDSKVVLFIGQSCFAIAFEYSIYNYHIG